MQAYVQISIKVLTQASDVHWITSFPRAGVEANG
jgi:hypothetical protein